MARFYTAYGTRKHTAGGTDRAAITRAALDDAGLPSELADLASSEEFDSVLRTTHDHVRAMVGDDLGTPVIALEGAAFFGPVCTSIPRGAEAVALFDAVRAAARCRSFTELKRGRGDQLTFT